MACTCVVGLQWGDEAKGKIVDLLGRRARLRRPLQRRGQRRPHRRLGRPDLQALAAAHRRPRAATYRRSSATASSSTRRGSSKKSTSSRTAGIAVGDNLAVSDHAHVIFPTTWKKRRLARAGPAAQAIGTTGRGIGPCYQDKVGRARAASASASCSIPTTCASGCATIVPHKNRLLHGARCQRRDDARALDADQLLTSTSAHAEQLRPYVTDTTTCCIARCREGRQAAPVRGGPGQPARRRSRHLSLRHQFQQPAGGHLERLRRAGPATSTRIIGVVKAYTTRVGRGPFPTELDDGRRHRRAHPQDRPRVRHRHRPAAAGRLVRRGRRPLHGRARRRRRDDRDAARRAERLPELKICTAYDLDGERIDALSRRRVPAGAVQAGATRRCPGWTQDMTGVRRRQDLPAAARRYVDRLERAGRAAGVGRLRRPGPGADDLGQ